MERSEIREMSARTLLRSMRATGFYCNRDKSDERAP